MTDSVDCPICGQPIDPTDDFCRYCGADFTVPGKILTPGLKKEALLKKEAIRKKRARRKVKAAMEKDGRKTLDYLLRDIPEELHKELHIARKKMGWTVKEFLLRGAWAMVDKSKIKK